ncbi:MAG: GNAT family N-acetyltransferase [Saprospiraceae bacterium]|nr:MAG: N-acetyltransferase GCN5 [Bacteroidetes bacterium OLB9]MCO6464128.1 GNAT family N-acetyltransferase [Saprospiraceae bacterium]MCZ2336827.1 GNAT family N-acetyltransferase [Chitinophagales bacterium]
MSFSIRSYRKHDKNNLLQLIRLNTPAYFAPEEEISFNTYLDEKVEMYFVVMANDHIVGCGGINFTDDNTTARISWDIFHPDYQGKSLGTMLMKHRLAILNTMPNIKKIMVRTSQVAYRFYEKQGFQLAEIKKDYWAPGFDMYVMIYQH